MKYRGNPPPTQSHLHVHAYENSPGFTHSPLFPLPSSPPTYPFAWRSGGYASISQVCYLSGMRTNISGSHTWLPEHPLEGIPSHVSYPSATDTSSSATDTPMPPLPLLSLSLPHSHPPSHPCASPSYHQSLHTPPFRPFLRIHSLPRSGSSMRNPTCLAAVPSLENKSLGDVCRG
jgi:hypothetical protein